jgi:hypothetical protein
MALGAKELLRYGKADRTSRLADVYALFYPANSANLVTVFSFRCSAYSWQAAQRMEN